MPLEGFLFSTFCVMVRSPVYKGMHRVLVLQSRITEENVERERANFTRAAAGKADLTFVSTVDEKLAWTSPTELLKGYDAAIFGGSSDFDFHGGRPDKDPIRLMSTIILGRARNIVSYALEKDIPILGVCFGHQIIGEMHQGMISNDKGQSKTGAYEVQLTDAGKTDPLFRHVPERFMAQYMHKDSVTNMPSGATILATGPACKYTALRYGHKVYTVQFHPEVETMPEGPRIESPEASKIVGLWIDKIVSRENA